MEQKRTKSSHQGHAYLNSQFYHFSRWNYCKFKVSTQTNRSFVMKNCTKGYFLTQNHQYRSILTLRDARTKHEIPYTTTHPPDIYKRQISPQIKGTMNVYSEISQTPFSFPSFISNSIPSYSQVYRKKYATVRLLTNKNCVLIL